MIKTRGKLITISALVVAAGLGACAQHAPGGQASPTDNRAERQVLVGAITQIYGTPEQRAAGWEGEHYAIQAVLAKCAERKNIEYTVNAWKPPHGEFPLSALDLPALFAPTLPDFGVAREHLMYAKLRNRPAPKATAPDPAQVMKFNECQMEAAPMDSLHRPAAQYSLENKFLAAQEAIHHELEPQLIGRYSTCMAHAGTPVANMTDAYSQVQRRFPPLLHQSPANPSATEGWADAVAFEKKIAAAHDQCRTANADALAMATATTVTTFLNQHHNEVEAVVAGWAAMPAIRDTAKKMAGR